MKKKITFLLILWSFAGFGQKKLSKRQSVVKSAIAAKVGKPVFKKADFFRVSPPLKEMIAQARLNPRGEAEHAKEREEKNEENEWHPQVTNNGLHRKDPLADVQKNNKSALAESINSLIDFDGVDNIDGVAPPDTQGDVNADYYVQCVNCHTVIKDRNGNDIVSAFPTSDFWQGTQFDDRNDGDPVILWDENAQRWLVTQFYVPSSGDQYLLIAVSETDDPTGSYYQYGFNYGTTMPDYPKWAIWPDAYYVGANGFDTTNNYSYEGAIVSAFDRDKMLQGDPNAGMVTFGPDSNLWSVFPADADTFPAYGTPCSFVSDQVDYTSGNNEVYIYDFHVDWTDTANSSFTQSTTLTVADYGLFSSGTEVPQPGTNQKLDLLHYRIMYRPYYRHFDDHESLLVTRTVDDGGIAAIRWYEFRNTGSGWSVYQQGTYNPGDGIWRWMPSIAMNQNGDITIAYSVSDDTSQYPSIRAVARYADDPLGEMTTNEIELFTGNASQDANNLSRWGDYSMVSVDPDGKSFWFTSEYTTGGWDWRTRIIHYELPAQCNYPATQASSLQTSVQSDTQIDLSWTRGDGDQVIVLAKQDAAVDSNPVDGTNYNANSTFGSGDQIGSGNYVVYIGSGTSVSITGLTTGTTYNFAVYEFNATDYCYLTPGITGQDKTFGIPDVTTLSMLQVNDTDAIGQGEVVADNGAAVTERGLCWSTAPNPDITGNHAANGSGLGTYTVDITGLTVNTTYYVRAYATNSYGTAYGLQKTFSTGCNLISDLPYLENFDAWTTSNPDTSCTADGSVTFDDCWENVVGDDSDWDIWSGATASSGTGPSDDANGGGNYIYLEASSCFNKTASILTPHFDFSAIANPYLTFFAHMFGSDMGYLDVYYTTDDGQNWTYLGSVIGNHGDQWIRYGADLGSLSGLASVQFKFTGVTGDDYKSDIALDNFVIKDYTPPADYCQSEGNLDYATAITQVNFNQISNDSGGKTNAYEDYTYISTVVQQTQSYDLSVNVDTDGNYTVYVKVWIDWNQDSDFDDPGEEYDLGSITNTSDGSTSNSPLSVAVPADATIGKTRMRVSAKYDDYATACEVDFDGEVEDYAVIVSTPDCPDIAYWNGAEWLDKDYNSLLPSDLSNRLIITTEFLLTDNNNIDACALKADSGNPVTISSGDYINLSFDVINEGGIDVQNNAVLVQTDNTATVTGDGAFELEVDAPNFNNQYDYAYWSIPIDGFNVGDVVSDAWRYYDFDATTQSWVFRTATDAMTIGRGYAISAPIGFGGGSIKASFSKTGQKFNTGTVQVPVYINGTGAQDDDDWNLVGNPYPSPVDFNSLAADNTLIQGAYYLWTNCAGLVNGQHQLAGYTTYSVGSGSTAACDGSGATASQYVPVAEGFYVEANASGDLIFNNSQRTSNLSPFVNRSNNNRVWIDFKEANHYQQILVGFFDNASDQKDRLFDAHHPNTADFALYSLIGKEKYVIQGLSPWQGADRVVNLGYTAIDNGTHTIALNHAEGELSLDVHVYLHDKYTGKWVDLKENDAQFESDPGTFNDRFELIFSRKSLETLKSERAGQLELRSKDDDFKLISGLSNIQMVEVYTIDGKFLLRFKPDTAANYLDMNLAKLSHQVLLFKVKLTDGKEITIKGVK